MSPSTFSLTQLSGLLIFVLLGMAFVGIVFPLSYLLRERNSDPLRNKIYECGMEPIGTPYVSPNIRFYIYALIFVVFDVEVVFILPWAVKFKELAVGGTIAMAVFLGLLTVGFIYEWKRGALKWE